MLLAGCCGGAFFLGVTLLAFLFPILRTNRQHTLQTVCLSHVHSNQAAMLLYVQDYDEHLPQATTWMDLIQPFESPSAKGSLHCPEVTRKYNGDRLKYGYAFDRRIGGAAMSSITAPATTRATYDSRNLDRNATDPGSTLAPRHLERAVAGFLDGHAGLVEGPKIE
jgi:prepilin-type processing-associated H-X9-DG protein